MNMRARSFAPSMQADEVALQRLVNRLTRGGTIPFDEVIARLEAQNLPPQLVQGSFIATITAPGPAGAQLLIPKNPLRKSFLVANPQSAAGSTILASYDAPLTATIAATAGLGLGVPVQALTYFSESNGSISINDIWVFSNVALASGVYPLIVIGYEGELAVTGNPAPQGYSNGGGI